MRTFPLGATIFLAILAILTIGRYSSDPFRPHEATERDKATILETQEILSNPNCVMIRLDFSTEEERYSFCYNSRNLFGSAGISLTSYGYDRKDFKKVSKQIVKIFERLGIKVRVKKPNDWLSNFQQTMTLEKYFPEQLNKIVEDFGNYFCNLEVVNWRIVPAIK